MGLGARMDRRSARLLTPYANERQLHREGAWGTLTYRHYRGPDFASPRHYRKCNVAKDVARWLLMLTTERLVVARGRVLLVNVPWRHDWMRALRFGQEKNALLIGFEISQFRQDARGTLEVRARCADPAALLRQMETLRARGATGR